MADIKLTNVRCISLSTPDEILVDGRPLADILVLAARAERAEADADEWYMLFQAGEDRAEKAEAERDDVMRHVEKMMLRVEAAEARAEKAEHERDLFRGLHREALGCVDRVFQPGGQKGDPVLPDFCRLGESKFEAVIRLAEEDKAHLAAIREWEGADDAHAKKAFARSYRADTRSRLEAAEAALRAIAEEAKRG